MQDEFKKERNFSKYDRRDHGYLVTFEHENEVNELLNKRIYHNLFSDILGERDTKVPYFIKFDVLNEYCKGKLKDKLFTVQNL